MAIYFLLPLVFLTSFLLGAEPEPPLKEGEFQILVQNRIVAQVNGKPLTALDVIKRMDFLFYKQYPEYLSLSQARLQFYQMNYDPVLQELIDRELMRADAVEMKIEIIPSDIRQELETTFGPDIISNLDKIGLRLDEAMEILKDELLIRRVSMYKVNSKAFRNVGPLEIKKAYEEWVVSNTEPQKWGYRLMTLRSPSAVDGMEVAQKVKEALIASESPEKVRDELLTEGVIPGNMSLSLSEVYVQPEDEIPPLIFPVVSSLLPGQVSDPFSQLSRKTGETAVRIVLLEEKIESHTPPLKEVDTRLKNLLLQRGMEEESKKYMAALREQYAVSLEPKAGGLPFRAVPKNLGS